MKKQIILVLLVLGAVMGYARDFTYTFEGQTLTYTVIDEEAKTCKTKEGIYPTEYPFTTPTPGNDISGELRLPEHPMDGNTQFTLTKIGAYSFYNLEKLTGSLTIPSTVSEIEQHAFDGCIGFNGHLTLPSSLIEIHEYAFSYCENFTDSLTIPNSVTTIENFAFYTCSRINTLTIGSSVNHIGFRAFYDWYGLKSVNVLASYPPDANIFTFSDYSLPLYVPEGKEYIYRNAPDQHMGISCWPKFETIEEKDFGDVGVDRITDDFNQNLPIEVYNLNGVKISESIDNVAPGTYIVRQGSTIKKIMVK